MGLWACRKADDKFYILLGRFQVHISVLLVFLYTLQTSIPGPPPTALSDHLMLDDVHTGTLTTPLNKATNEKG
jgi:hypothetical protein